MGLQSKTLTVEIYRLQRQATPPSPEEVGQQEQEEVVEIGEPRSSVMGAPTPVPTTHEVPADPHFEKPSVQQLLAQPGFSSGVLLAPSSSLLFSPFSFFLLFCSLLLFRGVHSHWAKTSSVCCSCQQVGKKY